MSIFIKGMNMPKSCFECPLNVGEYSPEYWEKRRCFITAHEMNEEDYIHPPKDCPLVEVPTPHGRLIDEDSIPVCMTLADTMSKGEFKGFLQALGTPIIGLTTESGKTIRMRCDDFYDLISGADMREE